MKRQEIAKKFDEIVAFAEVEQFIDTPVKHYSSGMYVRLGFSVLAHMDPDILIVDEVLAVGDVRFQKKCMGKMEDVGHQGRTVILVSHDMPAITRMCSRAILLNKGEVVQAGPAHDVVNHYLHAGHIQPAVEWPDPTQAPASTTRPTESEPIAEPAIRGEHAHSGRAPELRARHTCPP